jgi:hypothetical protein
VSYSPVALGCAQVTQVKAAALRRTQGWSDEQIEHDLWQPQYQRAGQQMYSLCVDMRGFYLKSGQFLGARGDFMPKPMCETLSRLHDQVRMFFCCREWQPFRRATSDGSESSAHCRLSCHSTASGHSH